MNSPVRPRLEMPQIDGTAQHNPNSGTPTCARMVCERRHQSDGSGGVNDYLDGETDSQKALAGRVAIAHHYVHRLDLACRRRQAGSGEKTLRRSAATSVQ